MSEAPETNASLFEETGFYWLDHGPKLTLPLEDIEFVITIVGLDWAFLDGMGTSIPWSFEGPPLEEIWLKVLVRLWGPP
jgi:hypothetical protein